MKRLSPIRHKLRRIVGFLFVFVFIILIKYLMESNDGQKEEEQNLAPFSVGVI